MCGVSYLWGHLCKGVSFVMDRPGMTWRQFYLTLNAYMSGHIYIRRFIFCLTFITLCLSTNKSETVFCALPASHFCLDTGTCMFESVSCALHVSHLCLWTDTCISETLICALAVSHLCLYGEGYYITETVKCALPVSHFCLYVERYNCNCKVCFTCVTFISEHRCTQKLAFAYCLQRIQVLYFFLPLLLYICAWAQIYQKY